MSACATGSKDKIQFDTLKENMSSNDQKKYTTCLLDMDGVLAEVSKSYRAAIQATCHHYGAKSVTFDTISDWKARGGCNNDWKIF